VKTKSRLQNSTCCVAKAIVARKSVQCGFESRSPYPNATSACISSLRCRRLFCFILAATYFPRGFPPKYRRRCRLSRPCSGWERVGHRRYDHQKADHNCLQRSSVKTFKSGLTFALPEQGKGVLQRNVLQSVSLQRQMREQKCVNAVYTRLRTVILRGVVFVVTDPCFARRPLAAFAAYSGQEEPERR
jgi:hypothetical protein